MKLLTEAKTKELSTKSNILVPGMSNIEISK